MNILFVVHQFFPHHYTGTERLTLQLARQIRRMGHSVYVLTCEPNQIDYDGYEQLEEGIRKKIYFIDTIPVFSFQNNDDRLSFDIFPPKIEKHLIDIIKRFDVVHFTHPMRNGIVLKICTSLGIPTVLTLTDNWLLCPRGLFTSDYELCDGPEEGKKCMKDCQMGTEVLKRYKDAKFFFENVDAIFTGADFVIKTFKENNWTRNIELNTFSMDYSFVENIEETKNNITTFAFMGTFDWHKGLQVLIDGFKKNLINNIRLKIYGSGDENSQYVKSLYKSAKKDKRIEFCGVYKYEDLPKIMKEISVMVIPSVYKEIYPLVIQLGFAYKKPIIASNIGGIPESIKDGINGYLFDAGNANQLNSIISKISNDPSTLEKLKKNIVSPPYIEEEAFVYSRVYERLTKNS